MMKLFNLLSIQNNAWKLALPVLMFIFMPTMADAENRVGTSGGQQKQLNCPQDQLPLGCAPYMMTK